MLGVGPAQKEIAVPLDVRDGDAAPAEVLRLLQELFDRGRLEFRERDEEVKDVAEKGDGLRAAPPALVERLQERPLVAGPTADVTIGKNRPHVSTIAQ